MKKRLLCGVCVCLLSVGSGMAQTQRSMTVDQLFSLIESGSNVLTAQKTGVDVASRAVEEAKSKRLPDINVSLTASYNGNVLMTDRDFSNAKGITQPPSAIPLRLRRSRWCMQAEPSTVASDLPNCRNNAARTPYRLPATRCVSSLLDSIWS